MQNPCMNLYDFLICSYQKSLAAEIPSGFGRAAQLMTILSAQFIRAVFAFEGFVGMIPEAFRMHENAQFPHHPDRKGHQQQTPGKKAPHPDHGSKHHQMVPVEDPAGGAAAVLEQQPERTPYQYTDQIAHIEENGHHQKLPIAQESPMMA